MSSDFRESRFGSQSQHYVRRLNHCASVSLPGGWGLWQRNHLHTVQERDTRGRLWMWSTALVGHAQGSFYRKPSTAEKARLSRAWWWGLDLGVNLPCDTEPLTLWRWFGYRCWRHFHSYEWVAQKWSNTAGFQNSSRCERLCSWADGGFGDGHNCRSQVTCTL